MVTATLKGMYPLRFFECLDGGKKLFTYWGANELLAVPCCGAAKERGTSGVSEPAFELLGVDHHPGSLI
jgi:hypothetical protein